MTGKTGESVRIDDVDAFADAVSTDLDDGVLREAAKALFANARENPGELAPAVDMLGDLIEYPDDAVRAWSVGAVGRVAGDRPDAVVPLVEERPDAVAPAAPDLRDLLDHHDVAVQHNAAGVLALLAGTHPDAVVPAAADLARLRDHDEAAVRRVAAGALATLANERPGAVAGGDDGTP